MKLSDAVRAIMDEDPKDSEDLSLDEEMAADQVAALISLATGNEVDGDGDPWSIVLTDLANLVRAVREVRLTDGLAEQIFVDEFCWGTCPRFDLEVGA